MVQVESFVIPYVKDKVIHRKCGKKEFSIINFYGADKIIR